MVLPLAIVTCINHLLIHVGKREEYMHVTAVGYSCVVFGWMTIIAQQQPDQQIQLIGFLHVPMSLAPFGSLIITSLIVPQASFIGHLSGIIVGYTISWEWFAMIDGRATFVLYALGALGVVYNLKQTNRLPRNYLSPTTTI
mmetsp:Transcript_33066/g.55370  ORF Transcript_33066/g.55370 Transcript_33066/m.55370 type:complete len:141 (-) Transcript_33066:96-518(-)